MAEDRVLLPKSLVPSRYSVHLTPDLKQFTFKGTVSSDVDVKEATSQVVVHSLDIKIEQVTFVPSGGNAVKAKDITYQVAEETATLHFEDSIKVGAGKLEIEYEGDLNNKMMGFYRSKYFVNGEERYMGTTQFEPTGARRAFPCWDEPALKAVFEIVLSVPEHLLPLSNMEPVDSQVKDGVKTVKFAPSPIMSTYLVAFIVGEFDFVEGQTKDGTKVRVYTPLGKSNQGEFAKDVAVNCLSYYNEYYGIPYPLPKLDMIAIADFAAGAMENWGLVTYRETALLIDEKNSGVATKQRVAYVVAHELAHQWFGNLVTMEWWKELWLNEGFATFVGNQAIVQLFPHWDIWTQFVSQYVNRALDLDSLESSHPIEVEVKNSAQIEEIFDAISYCKGASVIRMISDRVGEEAFRKGLNVYLNRHKYSNAVTEDLWKALSEASGFDVGTFMNAFTKSTGYPVVSVEGTANPEEFIVQQTRFLSDGKIQTGPDAQKWWVSIGVRTSNSKEISTHDLKEQKATIKLPVAGAEWFKVNADQSGFYRVKYTSDHLSKLSAAVSSLALPSVDRIGLQNDAFALAKAGMLPTADALTLAKGYINEVDYTVWSDLASNLDGMSIVWSAEPNHKELEAFIRNLFTPIGKKLGWDPKPGESDLDTLLRAVTLNQLSATGDKEIIAEARKRFDAYEKNPDSLPADLRFIVYKSVVVYGDKQDYERVLNIFRTADLHEEKLRALRALGYSRDPELIARSLELSLTEVREQDIFYVIASCSTHSQARQMSWDFLKSRWADFNQKLGSTAMLMDRLIQYATRGFASEEAAKSIREFFTANPVPAADRTIKQSIETILASAKWLESNRESVAKWLKENQ